MEILVLFGIAGVVCCFALYFALALLRHDSEEYKRSLSSAGHAKDSLCDRPSVAPSSIFRATIRAWCNFGAEQQIDAMDAFRNSLAEKSMRVPDDLTCLRFLRARQLDLGRALAMYESHDGWYTSTVAGRVMKTPLDEGLRRILEHSYPASVIGRDLLGRPVKLNNVGQLDMGSLKKLGIEGSQLLDFHIREMELLARCLCLRDESTQEEIQGRLGPDADAALHAKDPLLGHVSIFDTYDCSLPKFLSAISFWKTIAQVDADNYPEILGHAVFVRCPRLFYVAFNAMKHVVDPLTLAKFEVVEGDPFDRIAELVGPQNVPAVYCRSEHAQRILAGAGPQQEQGDCGSCGTCWGRK